MTAIPDYVTTDELVAEIDQLRAQVADLERRLEQARQTFAEQQDEIDRLKSPQSRTRKN